MRVNSTHEGKAPQTPKIKQIYPHLSNVMMGKCERVFKLHSNSNESSNDKFASSETLDIYDTQRAIMDLGIFASIDDLHVSVKALNITDESSTKLDVHLTFQNFTSVVKDLCLKPLSQGQMEALWHVYHTVAKPLKVENMNDSDLSTVLDTDGLRAFMDQLGHPEDPIELEC